MPIVRNRTGAHAAEPDIDPDIMMKGPPFAIPVKPGQPPVSLVVAIEPGDLRGFLLALGLIFGLVAILGVSVLPGY
jgi:hypothetical protein